MKIISLLVIAVTVGTGCSTPGPAGKQGLDGAQGAPGSPGVSGMPGTPGVPGKDGTGLVVDGARIHARWLTAADGARQFMGWHDTMLDVDCQWLTASDGMLRCLPVEPYSFAVYYYDMGCTQAFVASPTGCAEHQYAYVDVSPACPAHQYQMFKVGALLPAQPFPTYVTQKGLCAKAVGVLGDLYDGGTEIAASSFLAGSAL